MQLDMKQMKDRLKQDFSREVETLVLEEVIHELRKTFDNKSDNIDDGSGSKYSIR